MATSSSYDYTVTAAAIMLKAARALGIVSEGGSLSSDQSTNFQEGLNFLLKQLMSPGDRFLPGFKMWLRTESNLTLTATASYSIKVSGGDLTVHPPTKIIKAMLKDTSSNETPLTPMGVEEWQEISNKTNTGDPSRFYYQRDYSQGTLYLDYVPSDTTKTIDITHLREIQDIDATTNNIDMPVQYFRPLYMLLAQDMSLEYPGTAPPELPGMAAAALAIAQNFNPEQGENIFFEPNRD